MEVSRAGWGGPGAGVLGAPAGGSPLSWSPPRSTQTLEARGWQAPLGHPRGRLGPVRTSPGAPMGRVPGRAMQSVPTAPGITAAARSQLPTGVTERGRPVPSSRSVAAAAEGGQRSPWALRLFAGAGQIQPGWFPTPKQSWCLPPRTGKRPSNAQRLHGEVRPGGRR